MSESGTTQPARKLLLTPARGASGWLWLSGLVILLDQLTKALVANSLELYQSIELLPILNLTHLHNTGAAFSLLAGASGWQRWFFAVLGVVVSIVLMIWLRRINNKEQKLLALGLSLILGGALGNVIDRVWLGYVIDFVHVHWDSIGFSFAAFNVADSAISIGAGCLLLDAFFEGRKPSSAKPEAK
ncbi:MAG: signal peptidase II [Steroidobacteraceae bacterium]